MALVITLCFHGPAPPPGARAVVPRHASSPCAARRKKRRSVRQTAMAADRGRDRRSCWAYCNRSRSRRFRHGSSALPLSELPRSVCRSIAARLTNVLLCRILIAALFGNDVVYDFRGGSRPRGSPGCPAQKTSPRLARLLHALLLTQLQLFSTALMNSSGASDETL